MSLLNISHRTLTTTYIVWLLFWVTLQTLILYYSIGFSLAVSLTDASLNNALLGTAGFAMLNILQFYQPKPGIRIIYSMGLSVITMAILQWLLKLIITDNPEYIAFLDRSLIIRGVIGWLIISLISTMSWLWFYMREQQESQNRKLTTEKLAREAELATLRQQLQPHFLFNSLNSISALAGSRPEEARKMIQQLSDFLRGTLKKDDSQLVTLAEEIEHLQLYLEIEKVRFGHRLKTITTHDERSTTLKLPSLLLQPIVENAIKFGLYDTIGEITINISARTEDNTLVITVTNPFDPATSQPRQGTGFGLNAVQRRLYLLFARQDLLSTSQDQNIFTTTIRIPQTL